MFQTTGFRAPQDWLTREFVEKVFTPLSPGAAKLFDE
jgi:hypothetical protein